MDGLDVKFVGEPQATSSEGSTVINRVLDRVRNSRKNGSVQAGLIEKAVHLPPEDRVEPLAELVGMSYPGLSTFNKRFVACLVVGLPPTEQLQAIRAMTLPCPQNLDTLSVRYGLSIPSELIEESMD